MSSSNRKVLFVSTGVDNNIPPFVIATADNKNALVSPDAAVDDLAAATQQISLEECAQKRKLHQAELDSLFETSLGAQLNGLKKTPMPKLLQVELYPYQQTGVRWLAARENDTESVPVFWKERVYGSVHKWWHSLVNRAVDEKPSPNCGSILADEMGLGKTLQSIGLILANPPTGMSYPISKECNAPRCTIVVCPVSVVSTWQKELAKAVPENTLNVQVWEGPSRHRFLAPLLKNKFDVLLVSYETLASDFKQHVNEDEEDVDSILSVEWHRIILDEAHKVRNQSTRLYKAVMGLSSSRKLALTGTPVNNNPSDILALLAFMEVDFLSTKSIFEQVVLEPITNRRAIGLSRLRLAMADLALRRTKDQVEFPQELPDKTYFVQKVNFGDSTDGQLYEQLYDIARSVFCQVVAQAADDEDHGIHHSGTIFAFVNYLRYACCHGALLRPEFVERVDDVATRLSNGEVFAGGIDEVVQALAHDKEQAKPMPANSSSPKIVALLKEIKNMNRGETGVVFSEWTFFLDIVQVELKKAKISFTRLDGQMNRAARAEVIAQFDKKDGKSPRIMLCSLHAAGVGINLARANHVFMMNPFWNVAVEEQAMDRVHRLGQTRPVRVVRFIVEDSIEERMLDVQEAKYILGKGTMELLDKKELKHARLTALKDLFEYRDIDESMEWDKSFIASDSEEDMSV